MDCVSHILLEIVILADFESILGSFWEARGILLGTFLQHVFECVFGSSRLLDTVRVGGRGGALGRGGGGEPSRFESVSSFV